MDYTVAVNPEGIRLTGKGKRKPEVELRWRDLLSGEAAMNVGLAAFVIALSEEPLLAGCRHPREAASRLLITDSPHHRSPLLRVRP